MVGPLNPSVSVVERFADLFVEDFGRAPKDKDELLDYMARCLEAVLGDVRS